MKFTVPASPLHSQYVPGLSPLIPCLVIQSLYLSWQTHTLYVFQSQACLPFSKGSAPTSARVPELSRNYRTKKGLPPYPHGHPLSGCLKQAGQSTLQARPSATAPNPPQGQLSLDHSATGRRVWLWDLALSSYCQVFSSSYNANPPGLLYHHTRPWQLAWLLNFLVISPQEKELKNFKAKSLDFYCVKWIQPNTATQWKLQTSLNEPLQQIMSF